MASGASIDAPLDASILLLGLVQILLTVTVPITVLVPFPVPVSRNISKPIGAITMRVIVFVVMVTRAVIVAVIIVIFGWCMTPEASRSYTILRGGETAMVAVVMVIVGRIRVATGG
jgi:hypothetical protein